MVRASHSSLVRVPQLLMLPSPPPITAWNTTHRTWHAKNQWWEFGSAGSACFLGLLDPDSDPYVRGTDPHQNVTDPQHCLQQGLWIRKKPYAVELVVSDRGVEKSFKNLQRQISHTRYLAPESGFRLGSPGYPVRIQWIGTDMQPCKVPGNYCNKEKWPIKCSTIETQRKPKLLVM